jgi:NAD-dependent SIR2 family protein deacetylase
MENENNKLIKLAAELIAKHKQLLITCGAGISVDSGLPDYRGNEGLYKSYPPFRKLNVSFTDCANPKFFENHPTKAWYFYGHRYILYKNTQPHEGYSILNKIQDKYYGNNYFIYTSNVDGHFLKPELNFNPNNVIEIHGSINYVQCTNCKSIKKSELEVFLKFGDDLGEVEEVPKCDKCENMIRPNVLMFYDYEYLDDRYNEQYEKFKPFYDELDDCCIIEIGAGTQLPTVRNFSEDVLKTTINCSLIRINKAESQITFNKKLNILNPITVVDNGLSSNLNNVVCLPMGGKDALMQLANILL